MRDSKSSGKKPIDEVQAPRARKPKLERVSSKVAERKKAEEELKQSREFLANVINALDDPVFVKDEEHRWVVLNDAACEVMGRPREELIGKSDYDLFSKEQADVFWKRDDLVLKNGETDVNEEEITWHGKLHTISTKKSVFIDSATGKKLIAGTIRDITERKKAEEEIEAGKKKLETYIESMVDGVAVADSQNRLIQANEALAELLGYDSVNEMLGMDTADLVPKREISRIREAGKECIKKGTLRNFETIALRKDGWEVPVQLNGTALKDPSGKLVGNMSVIRDITDRKKAEEALRQSREKLRKHNKFLNNVLESLTHPFYVIDANDYTIKMANSAANLGRLKEGSTCYALTHNSKVPCGGEEHSCPLKEIKKTKKPVTAEHVHYGKDGSEKYVEVHGYPIFDSDGNVTEIIEYSLDITERKKAEDVLRESEKRYRSLFENMLDGFAYCKIIVDEKNKPIDFIYLEVNNAFEKLTGLKRKNTIGKKVTEAIPGIKEAHPELFDIYGKAALTGKEDEFDIHFKPLDIWLSISVYSPQKGYFVAIFDNITERKKAEEALRNSENFLSSIIDQSPFSTWIADANGTNIRQNAACRKLFGIDSNEETVGKYNIFSDTVLKEQEEHLKEIKKVFEEGKTVRFTIDYDFSKVKTVKVPKATHTLLDVTIFPIKDANGRVINAVVQHEDITERKRAEEALRLERDNFVNILDSMEDGVYIVAQNHDVQYVNPALKKEFGPLEGRKCYEYFHDRKEVCPWCKNKEVFAGKTVRWEWYSSKNQRTYDLIDTPLRNPGGSISKLEIFRDITERKRVEQKIKQINESYERLTDNADEAVFRVKADGGHIIYLNAAAERIFGYSLQEWLGDPNLGFKIIHPDYAEKQRQFIEQINTTKKKIKNAVLGWIAKDGREVLMEYTVLPITDENGEIVYFETIGRDITERNEAEERFLEYQAQLKSLASQLILAEEREKRRIATELHDQVSQSLVISKLKLETLRESESSAELGKALEEVCNSLGRTIAKTRSLTSEVHPPLLVLLGFEEAVAEWLTEKIQKKQGIAAEFEDDEQLKPLDDDIRILLFRDVRELLTNVVRHAHAKKVKVSICKVGSQISVSVEDDGVGFDPAEVTSMGLETNGFGLFSIQERLEELGGHLEIESETGHGAKVTMTAPLKGANIAEGRKI